MGRRVSSHPAERLLKTKVFGILTISGGALEIDKLILAPLADRSGGSHEGRFATYEGAKTCLSCHSQHGANAEEVFQSVHYQWQGDASETEGLTEGPAGKLGGINDFCVYPDINWIGKLTTVYGGKAAGGCAKCHAGLGLKPEQTAVPSQSQLENIDCLVCHSDLYRRTVGEIDGKLRFVPDTDNMATTPLQAAENIRLPSKDSCLNCHTKAGGGDNYKRGDIEEAHRDPLPDFDVHMASKSRGGAGLTCLDCHTAVNHQIAGRGSDLRPRELPDEVACTNCHAIKPHANNHIDKHTARVNCTVCHIPTFAKSAPTDMFRDWAKPGDLHPATGLYEPHMQKKNRVKPVYRFFNGISYFYQFGDAAVANGDGDVVMSEPLGSVTDSGAKLHAFKRHTANQPIDGQKRLTAPENRPVLSDRGHHPGHRWPGRRQVGWTYTGHDFTPTVRYMGIFHEVAPSHQALSCIDCHDDGGRLDFEALGYRPKTYYAGRTPLCLGCHDDEDEDEWSPNEYFEKLHDKHVRDKKKDCIECHFFSKAG